MRRMSPHLASTVCESARRQVVIRVYKYGLLPPIRNESRVQEQMLAAHRYRNTLVAVERARRAAVRAVRSAHPEIAALEVQHRNAAAALDAATDSIRRERARTHKRSETAAMRESSMAFRAARKKAAVALFDARRRIDPELAAANDEINERAAELRRNARYHCGLGGGGPHFGAWGTYLLVEAADRTARKTPIDDGTDARDPQFARWAGSGAVGVQIQGGMTTAELTSGQDTRLRLDGTPTWSTRRPPSCKDSPRLLRVLHARVGSDTREPVWASWPIVLHRPLPRDCRIKGARILCKRVANRDRWSVCFTVEMPLEARRCGAGAVALNLGWRVIGDELRVASWRGDDSAGEDVRLPSRLLASLHKTESLQSIRDERFDRARNALAQWLDAPSTVAPEWLRTRAATVAQWRSKARLAALCDHWRANLGESEEERYEFVALDRWLRGDRLPDGRADPSPRAWHGDNHLWTWATNQRRNALAQRREMYRLLGASLASRYETLVLEDFDLRAIARRPKAEEGAGNATARRNRQLAAVSELRTALTQAFLARGGHVAKVPARDTTRACHECGLTAKFDAAEILAPTCEGCGTRWDQDDRAALNVLARWMIARSSLAPDARGSRDGKTSNHLARSPESRWSRPKRMAREQREGTGGAPDAP
jgi:hypothetical protein